MTSANHMGSQSFKFGRGHSDHSHTSVHELKHQNISRKYLLHIPAILSNKAVPLILILHGAGGKAEDAATHYGWIEKAEKESFIVAFPQAAPLDPSSPADFKNNPNNWNDGHKRREKTIDDVSFLRSVIKDICSHYLIDGKRIYATGFSNGASMAFRIGIELSDVLAAVSAVSGHLWLEHLNPTRPMSILLIAGADDPFKPLKGGLEKNPWLKTEEAIPAMESSIKKWLKLTELDESKKTVEEMDGIKKISYGPNRKGLLVIFLIIAGQGHEWPGGRRLLPKILSGNNVHTFHATDAIWSFFSTQILE